MKIRCIIIEDEPLALERTKSYVLRLPHLDLLASFEGGVEALSFLRSAKVDLIFLDINMDELSGIQLLESIKIGSEVIITTAYDEYALKGFELNVTDYLLKPFTFERFISAVDKAQNNLAKKETAVEKKFIFIKTEYRLEKIFFNEILYIEGMRDYGIASLDYTGTGGVHLDYTNANITLGTVSSSGTRNVQSPDGFSLTSSPLFPPTSTPGRAM